MHTQAPAFAPLHFSTRELPTRERIPFWSEVFARQIVKVDIELQSGRPLEAEATLLALPELCATWFVSPTPARYERTPQIVADGDDAFVLFIDTGGSLTISHRGHDVPIAAGDAVSILHAEPATMQFSSVNYLALMVPRTVIAPFVPNLEDNAARLMPRGSEALRLLTDYLATLRDGAPLTDPAVAKLVATHVHDLMVMAIGSNGDGAAIAKRRGVAAVRLHAIKAEIAVDPGLDIETVAKLQHVTPRYIQMLFENEGTTFSAYLLNQRLARAHHLLTDGHHSGWTISAIAFRSGFGDLSHFNRAFKRRYGASPSEIRAHAQT